MKNKIVATDDTIKEIVKREIFKYDIYADLNHIDVSRVTNMGNLFMYSKFNGDISKWNVSNVTNMTEMFMDSAFNGDISKWDVSNVTDMSSMFNNACAFNGDISKWNMSNIKNIRYMFSNSHLASKIKTDKLDKVQLPTRIIRCMITIDKDTFANLKI